MTFIEHIIHISSFLRHHNINIDLRGEEEFCVIIGKEII